MSHASISSKEGPTPHRSDNEGDLEDLKIADEGRTELPGEMQSEAEKKDPGNPHLQDFPEGGTRGWLVVLGAALTLFCSFGYLNAFGVYEAYYKYKILPENSESAIAWIGSIQIFFLFSSGLFAGSIFDRYGARVLTIPASLALVLSLMMTSLSSKLWHFILAQGILGGIAQGFLFSPGLSTVSHYFQKRRGAAMGLVVGGSSIGGVVFPILLNVMLNESSLGFGWTVRILGFIFLVLLSIACLVIKERLPPRKGAFFLPKAFKNKAFVLITAGNFFVLFALFFPFFFLPARALQFGMSTSMSIYLVSILNALSFPGRIIPGIIADKFGRMNLMIICSSATAILIWCWLAVKSAAGLIIFAAFFGFASGSVISIFPAVLASVVPDPREIGTWLGMAMGVSGLAGLSGSPIAGQLLTKYGFPSAVYFSGSSIVLGITLLCAARFVTNPKLFVIV